MTCTLLETHSTGQIQLCCILPSSGPAQSIFNSIGWAELALINFTSYHHRNAVDFSCVRINLHDDDGVKREDGLLSRVLNYILGV